MGKKLTQEEFENRLHEYHGEKYSLITPFVNSKTKVRLYCNNCGNEFERFPSGVNSYTCDKCGDRSKAIRSAMINGNYLSKTHPLIAGMLKNINDGYCYSYATHTELDFICPNCGTIITKRPNELFNKYGKLVCPNCSDGFFYPEKFFRSFLDQCNVEYIYQYSSKDAKWCDSYRYDFYLPTYNIICETHGSQHYTGKYSCSKLTLEEQQTIDHKKIELANQNGVDVIEIDCRISDKDYIKTSILNSELLNLFDISRVDWNKCASNAVSSLLTIVCKQWNGNYGKVNDIAKENHIHPYTLLKYLKEGSELELCNFNYEEYLEYAKEIHYKKVSESLMRPIKCVETNEVFESRKAAMNYFGFDIKTRDINNPNHTSHGYHWVYLDQLDEVAS